MKQTLCWAILPSAEHDW